MNKDRTYGIVYDMWNIYVFSCDTDVPQQLTVATVKLSKQWLLLKQYDPLSLCLSIFLVSSNTISRKSW